MKQASDGTKEENEFTTLGHKVISNYNKHEFDQNESLIPCVLVATGTFSPVHRMHIINMELSKQHTDITNEIPNDITNFNVNINIFTFVVVCSLAASIKNNGSKCVFIDCNHTNIECKDPNTIRMTTDSSTITYNIIIQYFHFLVVERVLDCFSYSLHNITFLIPLPFEVGLQIEYTPNYSCSWVDSATFSFSHFVDI
eukprot:305923_1